MAKYKIWTTPKNHIIYEAEYAKEDRGAIIFYECDPEDGLIPSQYLLTEAILAMRDMSTNLINFYPKGDTNESYN